MFVFSYFNRRIGGGAEQGSEGRVVVRCWLMWIIFFFSSLFSILRVSFGELVYWFNYFVIRRRPVSAWVSVAALFHGQHRRRGDPHIEGAKEVPRWRRCNQVDTPWPSVEGHMFDNTGGHSKGWKWRTVAGGGGLEREVAGGVAGWEIDGSHKKIHTRCRNRS